MIIGGGPLQGRSRRKGAAARAPPLESDVPARGRSADSARGGSHLWPAARSRRGEHKSSSRKSAPPWSTARKIARARGCGKAALGRYIQDWALTGLAIAAFARRWHPSEAPSERRRRHLLRGSSRQRAWGACPAPTSRDGEPLWSLRMRAVKF